MPNQNYAWRRYAELQKLSQNITIVGDYSWGIERALNHLLKLIQAGAIPADPAELDAALKRAIASGSRLRRSQAASLRKWAAPPDSISVGNAAVANLEIAEVGNSLKPRDGSILFSAAYGYTDREIASNFGLTSGAVRVRLSRLRAKLGEDRESAIPPIHLSTNVTGAVGARYASLA